jgi:hypothetical protein
MNITGNQRLVSSGRAVNSDRLDDESLFVKKTLSAPTSTGNATVGNKGMATRIATWAGTLLAANATTRSASTEPSKDAIFMMLSRVEPTRIVIRLLKHKLFRSARKCFGLQLRRAGIFTIHVVLCTVPTLCALVQLTFSFVCS